MSIRSVLLCIIILTFSGLSFDLSTYNAIVSQNKSLSSSNLLSTVKPSKPYFSVIDDNNKNGLYLDSVKVKYNLTDDELAKLVQNKFVVSEKKSFNNFTSALTDVFNKDLPVFISTDAILNTLHLSYDAVLVTMEKQSFTRAIDSVIKGMRNTLPTLVQRYNGASIDSNLADVDLYLTIAASLYSGAKIAPTIASSSECDRVWEAIQAEQYVEMPLFSKEARDLDFSQFTPRGHYIRENLQNYFKTMIWLGRTEFLLTPPKQGDITLAKKNDLKRMAIDAFLLNELLKESNTESKLSKVDSLLSFMVGESDNLTSNEFDKVLASCKIDKANLLCSDSVYDKLADTLSKTAEASQKILSQVIMLNPSNDTLELPVSYLLLGQRFIVDSYIFGHVIFDKVEGRMMPNPLDAMYALGNNDAAPLLKSELEKYKYSPQLQTMRNLVDSYDQTFWHGSLYNTWLNSLRKLNPSEYPAVEKQPLFMNSAAWHQEKLNTQLGSWAQLRHDNLLYAKQSYTPGTTCSFPHGYVEPYPAFYKEIATFSRMAEQRFAATNITSITNYYHKVACIMDTLELLANKELNHEMFTTKDSSFISQTVAVQSMPMCGAPAISGWYINLIFDLNLIKSGDYTIADVHTQPTENDMIVGKVLHVSVGNVNLGFFLAESPSSKNQLMLFTGPVSSYYEQISTDFKRYTDEEWTDMVTKNNLPSRPDWVNCFLVDKTGAAFSEGRVLDGVSYSTPVINNKSSQKSFGAYCSKRGNDLQLTLPKQAPVQIVFYDMRGRAVVNQINKEYSQGSHVIKLPAASGIYTATVKVDGKVMSFQFAGVK